MVQGDAKGGGAQVAFGENSSYSNKPVSVKRAEFHAKPRYDALKLAHIFDKKVCRWDVNAIVDHQTEMLRLLRSHHVAE